MLTGMDNRAHSSVSKPLLPEPAPTVALLAPRIPAARLSDLEGLGSIRDLIKGLRVNALPAEEERLHRLERELIVSNRKRILRYAEPVSTHLAELVEQASNNWDALHHFRFQAEHGLEEALVYRYFYVPLAYRLGYYTLAAKLAQMTFETLLPAIERRVRGKVAELTGHSEGAAHSLAHERFLSSDPAVAYCYSRPKTPHSVWKKVGTAAALEQLSGARFAERVDDYVMVVWIMKIPADGNRLDAVANGIRCFCSDPSRLASVKRHSEPGPDDPPVAMAHAVWRGIPVEVQFLGGDILGWLTARDYGKYKVGTSLDDIEDHLPPENWRARGDAMLRIYEHSGLAYYEEGRRPEFHRILSDELRSRPVDYDRESPVPAALPIDSRRPNKKINRDLVWPGDQTPVLSG